MKVFAIEPAPDVRGKVPAKAGGLPRPPGPAQWPRCGRCGEPMRFLFQLPHHPDVGLDLSPADAVLVFQCENPQTMCLPFEPDSGGNRALAVPAGPRPAIGGERCAQPPYPELGMRFAAFLEDSAALSTDVNGATDAQLAAKEAAVEDAPTSKAGGVPIWPQSEAAPSCCGAPMRFVAQIAGEEFGLSFGDSGTGYLFRCARSCASPFKFLWQAF